MTKPTVEVSFGTWSAPEIRLTVEYAVTVMEEIRATACDGLQQLAHGGLEVGGVLFGSRSGDSVRILKWRPIACEHAEGPTLRLSTRDRIGLTRQIEVAKSDPDLAGLQPVGWFLSHCRSDIFLTAAELEIYNGFFDAPWQVTLVLRPARLGSARAGFFAREADGALRSESSYKDFTVEPVHRPAPLVERRAVPRRNLPLALNSKPEPRQQSRPEAAQPKPVDPPRFTAVKQAPSSTGRWLWMIPGCLAMLIVGAIINQKFGQQLMPAVNPQISFRAYTAGETVQVEWDINSASVLSAKQAVLELSDGSDDKHKQHYSLTAAQIHGGKLTYPRPASDVDLRMTVYPAIGSPVQESVRLVGPGSPSGTNRGQLEEEVMRLREELRKERAKNKKLKATAAVP
jgi:hypothetical protein